MSTSPNPTSAAPPIQVYLRAPDLERQRSLVLFRWLLLIPHLVFLVLWAFPIVLGLPVLWVAALSRGTVPDGLHRFYGAYVRYYASVWGYGAFVSDVFPQFDGRPGYAIDIEIPPPQPQSRWSILFRLVLALPPLLLAAALVRGGFSPGDASSTSGDGSSANTAISVGGGVLLCVAILGWFACMARSRMPQGLRDLAVYCIGYGAQAYGYLFLLTPRYPNAVPAVARPLPQPAHPVRATLDDDGQRTRLTVLLRILLFLPHLVWLVLWGIVAGLAVIASWFATLVAGRTPLPLHRFLAAYVRYAAHVNAFVHLVANPFPGFVGAADRYPFAVRVDPPEPQNRWVTAFRLVLAVPALLLAGALSSALTLAAIGSWAFALIMGRVPRGLRDLDAFVLRYLAQVWAYVLLLTDRYPYGGPTLATAPAPRPAMDGPPPPWEPTGDWLPPAPPASAPAPEAPPGPALAPEAPPAPPPPAP